MRGPTSRYAAEIGLVSSSAHPPPRKLVSFTTMDLPGLTYRGAAIDDVEIIERLPMELQQLIAQRNGFVAFRGGLHVRGACTAPEWHSLRAAMEGPASFAARFRTVKKDDVPFAQDVFGDQFILRGDKVHKLDSYADQLALVAD